MARTLPTGIDLLPSGKYRARITMAGDQVSIGTFATAREAVTARRRELVRSSRETLVRSLCARIRTMDERSLRLTADLLDAVKRHTASE